MLLTNGQNNTFDSSTPINVYSLCDNQCDDPVDHDGSHIKGLLINFIYSLWPSLCKFVGYDQLETDCYPLFLVGSWLFPIKGLLINFIYSFWPSLLKIPSFLFESYYQVQRSMKPCLYLLFIYLFLWKQLIRMEGIVLLHHAWVWTMERIFGWINIRLDYKVMLDSLLLVYFAIPAWAFVRIRWFYVFHSLIFQKFGQA